MKLEWIKNIIETVHGAKKEKYSIYKISRLLRYLGSVIILFTAIIGAFGLELSYYNVPIKMCDDTIILFFDKSIKLTIIGWILYNFLVSKSIKYVYISVSNGKEYKHMPLLFTIDNLVDFCCSLLFAMYSIKSFLFTIRAEYIENSMVKYASCAYLIISFVFWIYNTNSELWFKMHIEYTDCHDIEGKRIPKDAVVLYYGKRYKVIRRMTVNGTIGGWEIIPEWGRELEGIFLENAAKDVNGRLKLVDQS